MTIISSNRLLYATVCVRPETEAETHDRQKERIGNMAAGPRIQSRRKRIFEIIQIAGGTDAASRAFDRVIIALIILSIILTTVDTFKLSRTASDLVNLLDAVCMITFTIEYLLRLWTADLLYPDEKHPFLRYILSPAAVIDLLSFLPFYLSGIVPPGMIVFRLIRVARILRLFRINRYSDPLTVITSVLVRKASQILASVFLVLMLMLASSLLLYYAEHDAQPDVFTNAFSGLWWSVSTLSTIGYGDIYPVTILGKILAIIISLLGMSVVAIPTGIITAGFMEAAASETPDPAGGLANGPLNRRVLDITGPGTAAEAPARYYRGGDTMEQMALERFVGRCVVTTQKGVVTPDVIGTVMASSSAQAAKRILLRGDCTITKETALHMLEMGVLLVGIQGRSIGDSEVYYELTSRNTAILKELDLTEIEDGEYMLSAAPLKKENGEKAPCRAYLMY